ncbi:hypothetical protein GCM10025864_44770 [Luteimicrobium album]|uniref:Uncharacterized protein n=1 Tax=Luteimicrobium album TaxID=1054550 RepID=A0ABQ6I8M9_9MICO|nr:kelch repeat-containing protein [Luteimicrobium album]GMA22251.1 hypothetical protein GCM10025864_00100 [Luteimicrobium album]GMA26656.1 hypothetical protein GCM10025864_44150 [Luteimicrobium album]GMA26718.1 hypothetical protein GCM10025864_44770 [Luteimicrobium album]
MNTQHLPRHAKPGPLTGKLQFQEERAKLAARNGETCPPVPGRHRGSPKHTVVTVTSTLSIPDRARRAGANAITGEWWDPETNTWYRLDRTDFGFAVTDPSEVDAPIDYELTEQAA